MQAPSSIPIRVKRYFVAQPERVFDAWLDVKSAEKWLFATETGEMVRAEIDPRVGGGFTFTERRDGEDAEHVGEYVEIDRPRKLVFRFGMPAVTADLDRVTIEIAPNGEGCDLTLTHEMRPEWADYRDRTETGWIGILEGLAATLS